MIPLFDLDGTLLPTGNTAHANSFAWAFEKVYDIEASPHEVETSGLTDSEIIVNVLALRGVPQERAAVLFPQAARAMTEYFLAHEEEGSYIPLPGVREVLEWFWSWNLPVGLLTGNVEGVAWRKCEKAGIRSRISFGAFGNEAVKRSHLVPIAQARVAELGLRPAEFVIVGDTPRDIACAKEAGLKSIGVATGKYSVADLTAAGADRVFKDFGESRAEIIIALIEKGV